MNIWYGIRITATKRLVIKAAETVWNFRHQFLLMSPLYDCLNRIILVNPCAKRYIV
ncbi:hypothetical protein Galf_2175 [Gallionella capsiferriformans ES-2]|uniref:Uncharacterized protein n=1 Tax=Gallionella capsiferriformans (strain ES-2) TaxID=395494 RepID=D9SIL7_GALCS|nr:hypothetical protein Galf_2175 [Gallionella capsiferriformans ES-2]